MVEKTTVPGYDESTITVLEGLMPVRKRPGMYIGSTDSGGFHHLLWEVVDNSVDEALAGHCDTITVILNQDGSASVQDNGRGIPVGPQTSGSHKGMPTVEVACTVLHAGGKFENSYGGFTGGLHGVGLSVVNALSVWMKVSVRRDGQIHDIGFAAVDEHTESGEAIIFPGRTVERLRSHGRIPKSETGTTVTFMPDERVFSANTWKVADIRARIKQGAFLNHGLTIKLVDNTEGNGEEYTYCYPGGLVDYINELSLERCPNLGETGHERLHSEPIFISGEEDKDGPKDAFEMTLTWLPDDKYDVVSFANGIHTKSGGSHVKGFEMALTRLMNNYARQDHIGLLTEKDPNLEAMDVRSGLQVVLSAKVREAQFRGQTKEELNVESVKSMVRAGFQSGMMDWMQDHPVEARGILTKVIEAMRMRRKLEAMAEHAAGEGEKVGTTKGVVRSEKLSDCTSKDRSICELFIVEGDSAAGPAKKGRNAEFQAILAIRGKGLNIEKALTAANGAQKINDNAEVQGIIGTLGAGSGHYFDTEAMRYNKVIILTDADDDGRHIELLLITMFYRLMPGLIEGGHLYVARPPLYVIPSAKGPSVQLADDAELDAYLANNPKDSDKVLRMKGLGEMNVGELATSSITPGSRRIVKIQAEDASEASDAITSTMGTDAEKKWAVLKDVNVWERGK